MKISSFILALAYQEGFGFKIETQVGVKNASDSFFVLVTNFFTHGDTLIRKLMVSCQGRKEPPPHSVLKNWDLRIFNESVSMKGNGINKLTEGSYCDFELKSYASQ